uniref:Glycoprotein hormones alpha chain n=1 Tax=Knipowitschia caucasica TaxID=637954 RepID=A0AAV2JCC3_KNICA
MIRLLLLLVTYCCCCCCCMEASTVNQCHGCCFSRDFPTGQDTLETMLVQKNYTSKASCCMHYGEPTKVEWRGKIFDSHNQCQCQTCKYHTA